MSRALKIEDQTAMYFVTFTVVGWVDIFTRILYKNLLIDALKFCQREKGLKIHAFVIMTNHIHLILSSKSNKNSLSDTIRDFKKFTSGELIRKIQSEDESRKEWMLDIFSKAGKENPNNRNYQIWIQDNHPVILLTTKFTKQKLDYIHENPVKAGVVFSAWDYIYSSASAYAGLPTECLLDIDFLDFPKI